MPSKVKPFPLRIDEKLRTHLDALAALQGISTNAFMEFALESFVTHNPLDSAKRLTSWQTPYVCRKGPCPCGSGRKYTECHGVRVAKVIEPGPLPSNLAALRRKARSAKAAASVPCVKAKLRTVKLGRNDPCPCGSGQKFKRCCWSYTQLAR